MKKTTIAVAAAAVLLGAFVCLPIVRGQNDTPAARAPRTASKSIPGTSSGASGALKIAFIDFKTILRDYRKVTDRQQETTAIAEAGNAKIRQMQGEGQALVKTLQEGKVDQESEEFQTRQKRLFQLENSIKSCKATADRDIKLQAVKLTTAVYDDVQAALKLFCEQNGYTLVLQIDREAAETQDYRMTQAALNQHIFYNRSREDITAAVLNHLNRRYDATRAEAGISDSAPPASRTDEPTRTIPASPNRKPATR